MSDEDIERLESSLEALLKDALEKHVSIPWKLLPENSPIKKFAEAYNYYNDDCSEGYEWCEHVLTELCNIKTLDDLKIYSEKATVGDFYICSQLLKSGFNIPPRLMGELLERVIEEAVEAKAEIPALGIKNPKRGRPSDKKTREWYRGYLLHKIKELTEMKGMNLTEAYKNIAEERHKSPDTIRRDYERLMKARKEQRKRWESEKRGK